MNRIAFLTSHYPALSHTFVQREILALRDAGLAVDTFSIRRPCPTDPRSEIDEAEFSNTHYVLPPNLLRLLRDHLSLLAVRPWRYVTTLIYALTTRPAGLRAFLWQLFYFVEAVVVWSEMRRRGIRHVHVHFAMACASVAMIASRFGDCTFSMTTHGPAVFYDAERYLLAEKVRRSVMVSCISDFCRSQVMAFARHVDWPKLRIVHCGVDPARYVPVKRSAVETAGSVRLLNVARLSSVKGHAVLLRAMARLSQRGVDVTCTIVGDGPKRDGLERLSREMGIEQRVTFAGAVSQDEIQRFFDEADVFVLPSFAEGVPVVLMEAMAKELPVLTTRIMGIPELVDDGVSGLLVPPGNVERLMEAIVTLAGDAELRRRMGAEGRRKVCQEYDVASNGRQLLAVFVDAGVLEQMPDDAEEAAHDRVTERGYFPS